MKLAEIKLAAHPEGFQVSHDEARAFVNIPDAKQIAAIDLERGRQMAAWPVANLRANFPMAIDAADATLAIVFRSPARLVLLETAAGKITAQMETCGDADDVFFDARRHRLYVSCGEGAVDVIEQTGQGLRGIGRLKTVSGARTSLFVPELRPAVAALLESPGETVHRPTLVELQHERHVLQHDDRDFSPVEQTEDVIDKTRAAPCNPGRQPGL